MNYGRFFNLNQNLSDMVAGVTIFDYTELSAYEGLESDNTPSPKYPISMTITDNAVHFKMHYCIYRCSDANKDNPNPVYGFSIDDIKRQLYSAHPSGSDEQYKQSHNIVHIEEVILELPFTGFRTNELTETIKKSYIASFPQIYEKYKNDVSNDILTGNRFLDQLIEKVLSGHNLDSDAISYSTLWLMDLYDNDGNINLQSKGKDDLIDKFLRKLLLDFMFDLKHSSVFQTSAEYDRMYSGLMSNYYFSALIHKCEYYYYRDLTTQAIKTHEEKKQYTRKGEDEKELESNQKKVIHLYAKELFDAEEKWANDIRNPLSEESFEQDFPDDFNRTGKTQWGKWRTESRSLLCERMTTTCWDSWFACPEEEMRRIYFPSKSYHNEKSICNSTTLTEYFYNSPDIEELYPHARASRGKSSRWFLNRYDFNDVLHLHLTQHTNIICLSLAIIILSILWSSRSVQCLANLLSHFHNIINVILILACVIILFYLVFLEKKFKRANHLELCHYHYHLKKFSFTALTIVISISSIFTFIALTSFKVESFQRWMYFILIIIAIAIAIATALSLFLWRYNRCNSNETLCLTIPSIVLTVLTLVVYEIFQGWIFFVLIVFTIAIATTLGLFLWKHNPCKANKKSWPKTLIALSLLSLLALIAFISHEVEPLRECISSLLIASIFLIIFLFIKYSWFCKNVWIHPIKSGHLFLPKLTASIMTAWLTLSRGIERIIPFFENYFFIIVLLIIVFGFILYQIDKACPANSSGAKVFKTIEFFTISYCISLIVGLVVINFVGKQYLVNCGYVNNRYEQYVQSHQNDVILYYDETNYSNPIKINETHVNLFTCETKNDTVYGHQVPYGEQFIYIKKKATSNYAPTVIRLPLIGSRQGILIIPTFWLMSSVLAMFVGVFLQMLFFQEKQMTDI